jgi:glycosyltransferase involved in cell wall biosynthesis
MRIVQLIDNLYWGGAQRMLSMLTRELAHRQIETVVVSLDIIDADAHYAQQIRDNQIEVVAMVGTQLLDFARIRRLIHFFRQRNIDLIHTHLSYANIIGVLAGRLAGLPVVVTLHSTGIDRRFYHPVRHRLETMALRSIGCHVTAVGHAVAQAQQARVGEKKTIKVIPNAMAIMPDLASSERQKLRLSITGKNEGAILISVGRLTPDKGYSDMLVAFEKILRIHPDTSLLIAGEGDLMGALLEQTRSLGIEKQVFLLGARDDIPSLLKASDMYISASHREGMSMSLLESMAAALPTVTTNVGDAPRMFTDATGILVEPHRPDILAEAVNTLLSDPVRMQVMGRAACERIIAQYGLEPWTNVYVNLYEHMMEAR